MPIGERLARELERVHVDAEKVLHVLLGREGSGPILRGGNTDLFATDTSSRAPPAPGNAPTELFGDTSQSSVGGEETMTSTTVEKKRGRIRRRPPSS